MHKQKYDEAYFKYIKFLKISNMLLCLKPTLTLMLSIYFTMLNPLFGKCTLIDPVLAAGAAAAAPLPLSAISIDFAGVSPGALLP